MITPDEALVAVLRSTPAPRAERVPLGAAAGHVLAETIPCDRDYPPFDRAMMDGFGVRVADAPGAVRVVAEVPAGRPWDGRIGPGEAVEIMTGAPCPEGVEAVIPVEDAARIEAQVEFAAGIENGRNIAPQGSEWRAGAILVSAGSLITPLTAAALASVGASEPLVFRRPRVAVITTGDELARAGEAPAWYQLRDSNGPLLGALLQAAGAGALAFLHAGDTESALAAAFGQVREMDIVLLTGGVSAGRRDMVPQCSMAEGFEPVFHKVAQKPGKPLLFAVRGEQLLFGLPGNPLAVHLCAHRYVAAAIRKLTGKSIRPEVRMGTLVESVEVLGNRPWFCFACVQVSVDGYQLVPLRSVSSADVFTTAKAHAMIRLEPGTAYTTGQTIPFEWLLGGARP